MAALADASGYAELDVRTGRPDRPLRDGQLPVPLRGVEPAAHRSPRSRARAPGRTSATTNSPHVRRTATSPACRCCSSTASTRTPTAAPARPLDFRGAHPDVAAHACGSTPAAGTSTSTTAWSSTIAPLPPQGWRSTGCPTTSPLGRPGHAQADRPDDDRLALDRWRRERQAQGAAAAPVGKYDGRLRRRRSGAFDEELANATEAYNADAHGKKVRGCSATSRTASSSRRTPQHAPAGPAEVPARRRRPDVQARRRRSSTPSPRAAPSRGPDSRRRRPVGHPTGGGPIVIDRICGPVVKLAARHVRDPLLPHGHEQPEAVERPLAHGDAPGRRRVPAASCSRRRCASR